MGRKTLILTLPPITIGGVQAKTLILAKRLRDTGHNVTIAYHRLTHSKKINKKVFGGFPTVEVDCTTPLLEQNLTADSPSWRRLIYDHNRHIAVGGTILIAHPLARAGVQHMVWCGADLEGDRKFRQAAMPWYRKWIDKQIVAPALERQQEKVIAASNRIYTVSHDAADRILRLAPARRMDIEVMPIPVNTDFFIPSKRSVDSFKLGFAGRLDDPRKNAELMFAMLAKLLGSGIAATLSITGPPTSTLLSLASHHGVDENVSFEGLLSYDDLRLFYQSLDVFVISSFQEGLAIAGLEAMSCGVPVVSTRCGGPIDYVQDGKTGQLCDFCPEDMAKAVQNVLTPINRPILSAGARQKVEKSFSINTFQTSLNRAWQATWGEPL